MGAAAAKRDASRADVIPARDTPVEVLAEITARIKRVRFLAEVMAEGWLTKADRRWLSEAWGVTDNCVSRYACEANTARKLDLEGLEAKRVEHASHQERLAAKAELAGRYGESSAIIDRLGDLLGLKAPQKSEVTHVDATSKWSRAQQGDEAAQLEVATVLAAAVARFSPAARAVVMQALTAPALGVGSGEGEVER